MSYPYLRVKGLITEMNDIAELNRIVMYAKTRIRQVQEEAEWSYDEQR